MRYAYCINGFEDFNANIDLACEAEEAGWDGFFLPDGLALEVPNHGAMPLFDPWVIMGAIAVMTTLPRPFQDPRIPIWVVGVWEKPKSMQRALAWDGIIPQRYRDWQPFSAEDIRKIRDSIVQQRTGDRPFEIIAGGLTATGPQVVRPFVEAGATWWVEGDMGSLSLARLRERLRQGPPV